MQPYSPDDLRALQQLALPALAIAPLVIPGIIAGLGAIGGMFAKKKSADAQAEAQRRAEESKRQNYANRGTQNAAILQGLMKAYMPNANVIPAELLKNLSDRNWWLSRYRGGETPDYGAGNGWALGGGIFAEIAKDVAAGITGKTGYDTTPATTAASQGVLYGPPE